MDIDSEAQTDLALDDAEAVAVTGGIETTRKTTKHYSKAHTDVSTAPRMIVESAVVGTPIAAADTGLDGCAPESGGDPGNQVVTP